MKQIDQADITYGWLDTDSLQMEPEAQRITDPKRVQKYADDFSPALFHTVVVAPDEYGVPWITDGGHRHGVAVLLGIKQMHCQIVPGLDQADRAELFLAQQRERKGIPAEIVYRVSLTAGKRRECEIEAVLAPHGLRVGGTPGTHVIAAVQGLTKTWDLGESATEGGQLAVARTIEILSNTWGPMESGDRWQTDVLQGVGRLVVHNPGLDTARLIRKLSAQKPRTWVATAQQESQGSGGSGGRPIHMEKVMVNQYNSGLRVTSHNRLTTTNKVAR